jgi:hypothetical protein
MRNNSLEAQGHTLPRLGSRVRIPSPAPELFIKSNAYFPLGKDGLVALVLGKPGGSSRTQIAESRRLARTSVARVSEQGSKTAFPEINGIRLGLRE